MGIKLKDYGNGHWLFWCPGCNESHPYTVPRWSFNGDLEKPTFSPSLLIYDIEALRNNEKKTKCHLFVTDGKISYCDDCPHELRGKTVDMIDIEEVSEWL